MFGGKSDADRLIEHLETENERLRGEVAKLQEHLLAVLDGRAHRAVYQPTQVTTIPNESTSRRIPMETNSARKAVAFKPTITTEAAEEAFEKVIQ